MIDREMRTFCSVLYFESQIVTLVILFSEGWEKLGLYEYYKVKKAAKKTKEEEIAKGLRERSKSPSPIMIEPPKSTKPNKRRYRFGIKF